ncbi:long-chain fatty acid--CoA ligase [Synechococcus sp. RSCCF101]|uniref:class I adenylate-forming enzyme family protein n=1 Tax=Synechococcus sp. RSCCF101 TaxID=2511069 RepID=UPI001247A25B|nr:class I adenylate-forming enzyme family protein [Synechococcus sp. RSCCF101]QEY33024.1 long-chain fatty acid--CoA ligase [Synechococcus sp. RSCCF101]
MSTQLQDLLQNGLNHSPDREALRTNQGCWTFAELDRLADGVAAGLSQRGVMPGDRVLWSLVNGHPALLLSLACHRLGAVAVPVATRLTAVEIAAIVKRVQPALVLVPPERRQVLSPLLSLPASAVIDADALIAEAQRSERRWAAADVPPDHPALLLFTSGSTGQPKGVLHSHRSCWTSIDTSRQALGFTEEDVVLVGKPLSHAGGLQTQLLPALMAGARVVLTMRPSPAEAVALIQRHQVSEYGLLASDLLDFVDHLEVTETRLPSLRTVIGSGDSVPHELQERFQARFGWPALEGCGMTEVGGYYAMQPLEGPRRFGSIGRPTPGTRVRLLDASGVDLAGEPDGSQAAGQVAVQSESLFLGYWQDPDATEASLSDGWLLTGDLARRDADGFLWFVGRSKLMIVRRGSNIAPAEVEEVLDDHPAIHASVVVGVPHPRDGAVPVAWVVPADPADPPTLEQLEPHFRSRLAADRHPVALLIRDDLPRNLTGKFDRQRLAEEACQRVQHRATGGPAA